MDRYEQEPFVVPSSLADRQIDLLNELIGHGETSNAYTIAMNKNITSRCFGMTKFSIRRVRIVESLTIDETD